MFKNLQNKKELNLLIIVFVIIGIFGVAVKYFEFYNIKIISATTTDIYEHPLKVSNAALTIKLDVYKIHRDMKDIVLSLSNEELIALIEEVNKDELNVYENFNIIEHNILGDDGFILEKNTRKLFDAWKPIRDEVISLMKNDKRDDAIAITKGKGAKHVLKLEASAEKLYTYAHKKALDFKNKSESSFKILKTINLLISILFFFLFILIGYYIIQRISKFISKEERYRYAIEATNDGLWDWNLVTNEVYYSPRWKSMLGYSDDELENTLETWKNLIHPDDEKQAILDIELSHENKTTHYKNIHRLKHKDGHWVWIEIRGKTMFDENSKPVRTIGSHTDVTKEKVSEAEQQHLYELLQESQSLAKVGSFEYDLLEDKLTCSDEIFKIYGFSDFKMKLDKETFVKRQHPDDMQKAEEDFQNSLHSQEMSIAHNRIIRYDNQEVRYVEHRWKTQYDDSGNAVKTIGTTQDVTEQKAIQQSLKIEKYRYEMAEKIAHLGSWEQNNLDNTLQWSDEVYRIFEIDISEKMTFDHFMERVHPEDRDSVSQTFQKSVQEHVPYHLTHRLLFPDGRIKHVLEHAKHFYDDNNYMYTIGTVQDITQEYKTKELLQQKKRELETIFNEAPNPMMLHNEDGKVLMVNKVWKKLTGYSFDDIDTIEKWTKNAYGEKMPVVKEYIDKLYGLDSAVDEGEYSINTKNGDSIIWQFSSAPIGIIDNKRTVISSAMDITELKHKDEMLITQSRSAAMGEMIGMIAHQWRQPLTIISMDANNMLLDIALDDLDITQVKEHSNNIVMQTQHLSKTIDDFRNFFKPDKSILKIKPQEILEETYTIVKDSLANHNITLKTSYASESKVDAYPRELMQVFVNIINNAKDALLFKKSEGAHIDVKVFEDEKYVTTEICDNGGGIDEAILSKIFDPYFTTKDEKTGTGLGLYMSKMIIHDHLHGEIEAFNQNDGVCFSVKLPK